MAHCRGAGTGFRCLWWRGVLLRPLLASHRLHAMKVHFAHKTDEWETPQPFFDDLDKEFGFTLDVCASEANHKCKWYFSMQDCGLARNWEHSTCWMNPPYSQLRAWMKKASESAKR